MLTVFEIDVNFLAVKNSFLLIGLKKNVVGLDISMDIAKHMELLDYLYHLNSEFQNVHFLEVLFVFVKDGTDTFAKLVLYQNFRVFFNLLYLISIESAGFSPVLKLRKTLKTRGFYVFQNLELVEVLFLHKILIGDIDYFDNQLLGGLLILLTIWLWNNFNIKDGSIRSTADLVKNAIVDPSLTYNIWMSVEFLLKLR